MPTDKNAQEAYAGESQANRKYSVFAEKAAAEGYPAVGKLFRAASEAEAIHAKRLLFIQNAVGSTEENLKGAVEGRPLSSRRCTLSSLPRQRRSGRTRPLSSSPTP